jgi:hypothetical protein
MDYSALPNDTEGSSPWASSPRHNRSSFEPPTSDIPPSPLPTSPYGEDSREHQQESESGDHAPARESPQRNQSYGRQGQQSQSPTRGQEHALRHEPQRYHHGARQQRQQPPQYKLSAKITGLERTGRKDPILRFDVYVRNHCVYSYVRASCSFPI